MRSVGVTARNGAQWTVRVAWEPRWPALVRRFGGWRRRGGGLQLDNLGSTNLSTGGGGGGGFDLGDAVHVILLILAVLIAVVLAAALFWWVLLPLVLLAVDVAVLAILLLVAIVARVLFRRPWTVRATRADGKEITAAVVGWRAALRRRDEIAHRLRRGRRPLATSAAGPICVPPRTAEVVAGAR